MYSFRTKYNISSSLSLEGYSVASRETCFHIPELNIFLDCGLNTNLCPKMIFISHGHLDHFKALPGTIVEEECNAKIFVPVPIKTDIQNYIRSAFSVGRPRPNERICNIIDNIEGVYPNQELILNIKNHDWKVDIIRCFHSTPTDGFGFSELRKKLKPEFKELEGREIAKLKQEGVEITEIIEYPQFCYLGDTDQRIFENDILLKFPVIMIECTFLNQEDIRNAKKKRHMHWIYLESYIRMNFQIKFVLFHFSAKHNTRDIIGFFEQYIDQESPDYMDNIFLWT